MAGETKLDFSKAGGLVPAVVQDFATRKVLMVGFMNEEALEKTKSGGKVTFFSRTKNRLWTKGETSGNFLEVKELLIDCDQDTVLVYANPIGPVCHTGSDTCFNEENKGLAPFLHHLQDVVHDRKVNPSDESYTTSLFKKGLNKITQKVGEEAIELVIEAKDQNKDLFLNEAADLMFHMTVLLEEKGYTWDEIFTVLKERHQ
jgi:phosphoribosyl-ATP pyrophosphohydrolase/phosphoribosyl-AMP cyclohydrolase